MFSSVSHFGLQEGVFFPVTQIFCTLTKYSREIVLYQFTPVNLFHSVFRQLIQVDPDAFWFTLNELHCPSPYIPPHPDLLPVKLKGMGRQRDEYSDNVLKLLREEFG